MSANLTASPVPEGDYQALKDAWKRYLTSERPIDSVLKQPAFQQQGLKVCAGIVRNAERCGDIFQVLCAQLLRHDTEGPKRSKGDRAKSLRAAGLQTLAQFWAYVYVSARNLAKSGWAKDKRRSERAKAHYETAPTYHGSAEDLARVEDEGLNPERSAELIEALKALAALDEKHRLTFYYWARGDSFRKIAKVMGCSHVTARNRLKVALKQALGREMPPAG
jgi:RNA polymerase sigma factor (sigma-70 family)